MDVEGLFEGLLQLESISLSPRDCSQSGQSAHYVIVRRRWIDLMGISLLLPSSGRVSASYALNEGF